MVERERGTVAVVVPTRNRGGRLVLTLARVLAQQDVDLEVIVVDDASNDDTADRLREVADPRVQVVRHDIRLGAAAARNNGAAVARSAWLAFCDDDDLWAPTKLRRQLDALDAQPDARWCLVGDVWVDDALRPLAVNRARRLDLPRDMFVWNQPPGGGSGTIVASDAFDEVGGFDPCLERCQDWDLWIRLALLDPSPAVVNDPLVAWVRHPGQMSNDTEPTIDALLTIADRYRDERVHHGVADRDIRRAEDIVRPLRIHRGVVPALRASWRLRTLIGPVTAVRLAVVVAVPNWLRRRRADRSARRLRADPEVRKLLASISGDSSHELTVDHDR